MDSDQIFAKAIGHHQNGQSSEAEVLYQQILNTEPNHADALYYLGRIANEKGEAQQALALMNGNYMAVNELTTKLNEFETAIEKNNPKLLYGLLNDMQQTMLGVVSALNESALLDTNIDMSKIESGITTTGLTLDTYNTNLGNVPGTGEATG